MPIMQALIVGGGQPESVIVETDTTTPKPLVTILPDIRSAVFDPSVIFGAKIIDVELWAGGGASGSARDGVSGDGGAGGYVKARINLSNIDGVEIKVGGGGGTPDYYAIPSDEYATENIANIVPVGTASANSAVSLTTPSEVTGLRSTVGASAGVNPAVSFQSSIAVPPGSTSITPSSSAGNIIILASSCDQGTIPELLGYTTLSSSNGGNPSYRVQYKVAAVANEPITGLTASLTVNGVARPVSHLVQVFANVDTVNGIDVNESATTDQPDSPSINSNLTGAMGVSFGFFDDIGIPPASVTAPAGHTNLTVANSTNSPTSVTPVTTLTIGGLPGDTFVATTNTDTSFTIGGLTAGDFVIVIAGSDGQTPASPTPTSPNPLTGWVTLSSGGGTNPGRRVAYTFATGTSITLNGLSNPENDPGSDPPILDQNIAYTVLAFRGVDPDEPINDSAEDTNNTGDPNPPEVTPNIDGCMIVALGVLDDDSEAPSVTAPDGFTLGPVAATSSPGDNNNATVMSAYLLQTTAGAINPNAFGGDGSDNWFAITIALTPARIDSTVMVANQALPDTGNYNPNAFNLGGLSGPSWGVSVLLSRSNNFVASPTSITLPTVPIAAAPNDIIIVASFADAGILDVPDGFSNLDSGTGYSLSWKRWISAADNSIIGLSPLGEDNNGNSALIRHVAYVYRNVSTLNPINISTDSGTNDTTINPSAVALDGSEYAVVPFVFIRDVSLTAITNISVSDTINYPSSSVYPVGSNSTGISEATLVNAFGSGLPDNPTETPTSFTITPSGVDWNSVTVALRPTAAAAGSFTGSITLPLGIEVGDLVLVASVSDAGTLSTPLNYTSITNINGQDPSYQLSYKFIESSTETTVDGLTTTTVQTGGPSSGQPRGTAHIVQVFRGADPAATISFADSSNNNGNPNPPPINGVAANNIVAAFAFVDDISITATAPGGYTLGALQSVGTNPNGSQEATVMCAYNLNPTTPEEDPGSFNVSNEDAWEAVTILIENNVTQRFYPSDPGGCGGSSGGYTALFDNLTKDLILMVGAGGGGGGSSVIPIGAAAGTPASAAYRSVGGSGGVGGGNGNAGGNGSSGLSFLEGTSFAIAGQFGSGGTLISGGIGGNATQIGSPTILVSNPGETGVAYTNNTSGSRGANSPYNTSDIPLQGANATGGYIAGRGGGSSRTNLTVSDATIPLDCGGAGGPGYYGGGGGGPGLYGGGGGGGGGCSYHNPSIVTILSSEVGVGTNPAGQGSGFWNFPIAVGGSRVIGNNTSPIPATTTSIGNSGGDGRVVITYLTV